MFILEEMKPMNVENLQKDIDGNINPFRSDAYCMGRRISKHVYMMFDFHDTEPFRYAYFINTKTGERQRIKLINEKEIV